MEENIEDDDLDGLPLDGAALLKTAIKSLKKDEEDIDGIPSNVFNNIIISFRSMGMLCSQISAKGRCTKTFKKSIKLSLKYSDII